VKDVTHSQSQGLTPQKTPQNKASGGGEEQVKEVKTSEPSTYGIDAI